jgi:hypothetical protein
LDYRYGTGYDSYHGFYYFSHMISESYAFIFECELSRMFWKDFALEAKQPQALQTKQPHPEHHTGFQTFLARHIKIMHKIMLLMINS